VRAGADKRTPGELLDAAVALHCEREQLVGYERYAELSGLLLVLVLQLIPTVVDAHDEAQLIGCGVGEPHSRMREGNRIANRMERE